MIQLKAERDTVEFTYEFRDGKTAVFTYTGPTTDMIDEGSAVFGTKPTLEYSKKMLEQCLSGDAKEIKKLFKEQQEHANIYKFKRALDEQLGN